MKNLFADRMATTHKSFIREILKVTQDSKVISFAGGLPNPRLFPVKELADAYQEVLRQDGENVLQYSTTEGYLPLREYIAERYFIKRGLQVSPDEILITTGSQQGLDLIGKVFLNKGDRIVIERPGYLGAIGADKTKLFHTVINFQNPSGVTYSRQKREKLAGIFKNHDTLLIEDNPYGELRFMGEDLPSMKSYLPDTTIVLGSFSKVVTPGLRLGWICATPDVMEKLIVAKQSSDLHSNYLSQRAVYQYLIDNDLDEHILNIRKVYKRQRDLMVTMIEKHFPQEIKCTRPEGGMFLWVTLPADLSALHLFKLATEENVAFVPGKAFYVDGGGSNTLRLNFSNSDEEKIEEGIKRLAKVLKRTLTENKEV
jgi:2-aminoadipate transaminase